MFLREQRAKTRFESIDHHCNGSSMWLADQLSDHEGYLMKVDPTIDMKQILAQVDAF